jgi:Ca2+-binding RTX toxin-like protein
MVTTFTGVERFVGTDQADIMISGATGANMNGAAGDDEITGGSGADTITGGEGQDTLNGGGGDDTFVIGTQAADGTDDIIGGSGVDTIQIGAGASFVFSTADSKLQGVENVQLGSGASVTLTGQQEGFNVIGGGGAETIITSAGDDTVNAGLGDDFIQAAAGADVINGGAGRDTVSYADVTGVTSHGEAAVTGMAVNFTGESIAETGAAGITAQINGLTATAGIVTGNFDPNNALGAGTVQYLTGTKGTTADEYAIDTITSIEGFVGSALNDYIVLGADAVTVDAGAGRDIIFSGTAADNINAGSGDDFVMIASSADHSADETIDGGAGTDVIAFTSVLGETLVLSANVTGVETVQVTDALGSEAGLTAENIDASAVTAGLNILGNDGNNRITGTAFADTMDGNKGDDTYVVTNGDTVVETAAEGTDTIIVTENATFAAAGLVSVEAAQLASGVTLTVDHSDVGAGPLEVLATITGVADDATETLVINGSTLVAATLDMSNVTVTNVVVDYRGGVGVDTFTGTAAADIISGGFGDDVLDGNGGADIMSGGDGKDTFTIKGNDSATTIVTITDFEAELIGDGLVLIDKTLTATLARADLFDALTLSSGDTVESFEVSATGVVTLYDESTAAGFGGTQTLNAVTDADVVALVEAILLNTATKGAYTFGLDANGDGTAESSIVFSSDLATETNIVELVGVAGGTDLAVALAAGDIFIS